MDFEKRLLDIEGDLKELTDKKKDKWDKISIVASILIPLSIAFVGGMYSYFSQLAETEIADIRTTAELKVSQAELVSKFFDPLTGSNKEKREIAVETLLIAAPYYGPVLVRVSSKVTDDQDAALYASEALNQRRQVIISQMYSDEPSVRKEAYAQLLASWGNDETLVSSLIKYGTDHKDNVNGIYNTLVLLSHLNKEVIVKKHDEIQMFVQFVTEGKGPKTKKRGDILLKRIKK